MARKSFEIFNVLVSSKYLRSLFAQRFSLKGESSRRHDASVSAWGRPVESDEFPTGTGKANPLDHILRVMRLSHPMFPVEVREMAAVVQTEADRLDMESGASEICPTGAGSGGGNPCGLLMQSMREQLDVLERIESKAEMTPERVAELDQEWTEFESSFFQVKGCVQAFINQFKRGGEVE